MYSFNASQSHDKSATWPVPSHPEHDSYRVAIASYPAQDNGSGSQVTAPIVTQDTATGGRTPERNCALFTFIGQSGYPITFVQAVREAEAVHRDANRGPSSLLESEPLDGKLLFKWNKNSLRYEATHTFPVRACITTPDPRAGKDATKIGTAYVTVTTSYKYPSVRKQPKYTPDPFEWQPPSHSVAKFMDRSDLDVGKIHTDGRGSGPQYEIKQVTGVHHFLEEDTDITGHVYGEVSPGPRLSHPTITLSVSSPTRRVKHYIPPLEAVTAAWNSQ